MGRRGSGVHGICEGPSSHGTQAGHGRGHHRARSCRKHIQRGGHRCDAKRRQEAKQKAERDRFPPTRWWCRIGHERHQVRELRCARVPSPTSRTAWGRRPCQNFAMSAASVATTRTDEHRRCQSSIAGNSAYCRQRPAPSSPKVRPMPLSWA
jgi:hypothetical protein